MSPSLYGQEKSDDEVVTFVRDHRETILEDPDQRYHTLMRLLPGDSSRLLDYGCGWGINTLGAAERGHAATGIDISPNEIEICRLVWGERDRLRFLQESIDDLEDASFDVVLSAEVIEHVHNVGTYLSGINRVLTSDGALVISTPCGPTPRNVWPLIRRDLETPLVEASLRCGAGYDKTHHHIHSWDQHHFVRLLASCGFVLERYEPAEGVPLPWWVKRRFGGTGYLRGYHGRFRHLCRTMVFRFRKVDEVVIGPND